MLPHAKLPAREGQGPQHDPALPRLRRPRRLPDRAHRITNGRDTFQKKRRDGIGRSDRSCVGASERRLLRRDILEALRLLVTCVAVGFGWCPQAPLFERE
jgi:hypothetical protein